MLCGYKDVYTKGLFESPLVVSSDAELWWFIRPFDYPLYLVEARVVLHTIQSTSTAQHVVDPLLRTGFAAITKRLLYILCVIVSTCWRRYDVSEIDKSSGLLFVYRKAFEEIVLTDAIYSFDKMDSWPHHVDPMSWQIKAILVSGFLSIHKFWSTEWLMLRFNTK